MIIQLKKYNIFFNLISNYVKSVLKIKTFVMKKYTNGRYKFGILFSYFVIDFRMKLKDIYISVFMYNLDIELAKEILSNSL